MPGRERSEGKKCGFEGFATDRSSELGRENLPCGPQFVLETMMGVASEGVDVISHKSPSGSFTN